MAISQFSYGTDFMSDFSKHSFSFWKENADKVCDDEEDIKGKIVIVTGCNTGIGKMIALQLAKRGAVVIMAVRDLEKGQAALDDIKKRLSPLDPKIELMLMDLCEIQSIRDFVKDFKSKYSHLNILINNAGFLDTNGKLLKTKDGFEQHIGVNHLGPFLLTRLLVDSLKKGAPSRVVCLSTSHIAIAHFELDNLMMEKKIKTGDNGKEQYGLSKLVNAICIRKFAEALEQDSGIKVLLVCPGFVKSDILRNENRLSKKIGIAVTSALIGLTPHQGSETAVFCSVSKSVIAGPDGGKGDFYRFLKRWERGDKLMSDYVKLEQVETLYRLSEELVGLQEKSA